MSSEEYDTEDPQCFICDKVIHHPLPATDLCRDCIDAETKRHAPETHR